MASETVFKRRIITYGGAYIGYDAVLGAGGSHTKLSTLLDSLTGGEKVLLKAGAYPEDTAIAFDVNAEFETRPSSTSNVVDIACGGAEVTTQLGKEQPIYSTSVLDTTGSGSTKHDLTGAVALGAARSHIYVPGLGLQAVSSVDDANDWIYSAEAVKGGYTSVRWVEMNLVDLAFTGNGVLRFSGQAQTNAYLSQWWGVRINAARTVRLDWYNSVTDGQALIGIWAVGVVDSDFKFALRNYDQAGAYDFTPFYGVCLFDSSISMQSGGHRDLGGAGKTHTSLGLFDCEGLRFTALHGGYATTSATKRKLNVSDVTQSVIDITDYVATDASALATTTGSRIYENGVKTA